MRGEIEALRLIFRRRPEAEHRIDDLVEDGRVDSGPENGYDNGHALNPQLRGDGEIVPDRAAQPRRREAACAECADYAPDAENAEHVKRVFIAEFVLHHGHKEVANR